MGTQRAQVIAGPGGWREARLEVPGGGRWKYLPAEVELRTAPVGARAEAADEMRVQVGLPFVVDIR